MRTSQTSDTPRATTPRALPHCIYPTAADVALHGVQPLPASLPLVDFEATLPYRGRFAAVPAVQLTSTQVLDLMRAVAASFARREPQCRHLQAPKHPAPGVVDARHADPFGSETFGPWTTESHLYWFIRLLVLTDPTSPRGKIAVNHESLEQSLAIVDDGGAVIGGALNETMPPIDASRAFREGDPFLDAALTWIEPILNMLAAQDAEAVTALCDRYPAFLDAYAHGKVGHHFIVARTDTLAKEDAFELVAGSAERYRTLGFAYMLIEATNQWTGAACEALGAVRVHFSPYQAKPVVRRSAEPLDDVVTSPTGFLSDKDSGSMFYALRLQ
jgi:hypothetical protein